MVLGGAPGSTSGTIRILLGMGLRSPLSRLGEVRRPVHGPGSARMLDDAVGPRRRDGTGPAGFPDPLQRPSQPGARGEDGGHPRPAIGLAPRSGYGRRMVRAGVQ